MSVTVTFDGGRRGWATTMLCQLCKTYGHEHTSHFAYLTMSAEEGTWQFASLRDADIQKIMDRIEPAEAAKLKSQQEVFQACFKCCGLKVHNSEFAFVKKLDGACVEPAMPNNQFKKAQQQNHEE